MARKPTVKRVVVAEGSSDRWGAIVAMSGQRCAFGSGRGGDDRRVAEGCWTQQTASALPVEGCAMSGGCIARGAFAGRPSVVGARRRIAAATAALVMGWNHSTAYDHVRRLVCQGRLKTDPLAPVEN